MIHAPKIYADPGNLDIPITVDEDVAGVQFDLFFDSTVASFGSIQYATGASGLHNEISAGHLKVVVSSATNLSNPVCIITLDISESTPLELDNARGSTEQAVSFPLETDDGEVLVGVPMDVLVQWQANPPSQAITAYKVHQDGAEVGQVDGSILEFTVTGVATNQGDVAFQVSAVNALGEGPLSDPAVVNTDLPTKVQGVTAEIV